MNVFNQNPVVVAAAAMAFYAALVGWVTEIVTNVPVAVESTGAALLLAIGAFVGGRFVQSNYTDPTVGGE